MALSENHPGSTRNGVASNIPAGRNLDGIIAELVTNGSIELSTSDEAQVKEAADLLPVGMCAYVPSVSMQPLSGNLERVRLLHAAGFDVVPHLAARKIASRNELKAYLQQVVQDYGVHRVLVIGGDEPNAIGPFKDSAAILRDGILSDSGIDHVEIAGYPEGHPEIPLPALHADLEDKLSLASSQGLGADIVTQFSFAPARILEYCANIAHTHPDVPVYVGMVGPSNPAKLLHYARYCGVSASLRALGRLGFKATSLVMHTDPTEQLTALAHYCATRDSCNVIGVHIFSFGGFKKSAQWMRNMCRGKH